MALSDERIWASDAIMRANAAAGLPMPILGMLCRIIEAEVRKDDDALILQLVDALEAGLKEVIATGESEGVLFGPDQHVDAKLQEAITAARARLAPPPPTA